VQPETATHPIIRTYKGREKRAAENAYRADARQAAVAGWIPVAHRWSETWEGVELAVVFQHRTAEVLRAPAVAVAGAAVAAEATLQAPEVSSQVIDAAAAQEAADIAEARAREEQEAADRAEREERERREAEAVALAAIAARERESQTEPAEPAEPADDAAGAEDPTGSLPADDATLPHPSAADDLDDAHAPVELDDAAALAVAGGVALADPESQLADAPGTAGPEPDDEPAVAAVDEDAALVVHPPSPESQTAARSHARAYLQTLELHCAGEPLRLIRTGYPQVPQGPILERRRWVEEHADWARRVLMYEPRGHRDMYGAVLLPPDRTDADIAVLFLHNAGYSTMCGHGIIALTTGLIEERLYPATEPVTVIRYETPAGLVTATADIRIGAHGGPEVRLVRFYNVPAYRHQANIVLDVPGVALHGDAVARGGIRVDLAFGGAYYGIVDAAELGLRVVPEQVDELTRVGAAITEQLRRDHTPTHPTEPDLGFVYGTIIVDTDPATSPDGRGRGATMRNVTVFADAEVDRSPCGSGTSALLAHLYAQGRLAIGQSIVNASITGEAFEARVEAEALVGDRPAVTTSVAGIGFVTGYGSYVVDERDPLGDGFLLR
jgi:trans-L-3-hydroxyproline dehydratase